MLLHTLPIEVLRYLLVVWCYADDLEALASVCSNIQRLINRLSNVLVLHHKPFNVPKGAMANLTHLSLRNNRIGDSRMQTFASAVDSGALTSLKELVVPSPHE